MLIVQGTLPPLHGEQQSSRFTAKKKKVERQQFLSKSADSTDRVKTL